MSRHARFWFLALFLGLAVIPMVYLTFTWSPEEPLRFRLAPVPGQSHADVKVYEVEVVNTRGVPIRLYDGILWMDFGNASSRGISGAPVSSPAPAPFFAQLDIEATLSGWSSRPGSAKSARGYRLLPGRGLVIPSHGVRTCRIRMLEGDGVISQGGHLRIRYLWISQPRHLTSSAMSWIRQRAPASLKPRLPMLKLEDESGTVDYQEEQLESAPGMGQGRVATTSVR
ncbi:hypothetical protein DES53_115100 [Roseimicrobium gellanilyticum]|uniref:Uncharacterized protein n=1 Tax=Roseimicrobium gellanilyticum TaxID=748857 RepID=A0A366H4X4_9BACT|nr:hypothetical protein [Roseimicrobium gellanilyticum]RBP36959.1 hypothetical protein DES53_115100 [Roseimicrobium gellanilyticum]